MISATVKIVGITPLLMHNGNLADPLHPSAKALASAVRRAKKSKTEDAQIEMRRTEWMGGLYVNDDGCPVIPSDVFEACIVAGAKRLRLGPKAKAGIVVTNDALLQYDGPKTPDKLWEDGRFIKIAGVRVGQSRVIRTRPIFPEWSAVFEVLWDQQEIADETTFCDIIDNAGNAGMGNWRPRFGRFIRE